MPKSETELNETPASWYALKIFSDRPAIMQYFAANGMEVYCPVVNGKRLLGTIVFIRCIEKDVLMAKNKWFRQLMLYRNPGNTQPKAIPDAEMDNFRMVIGRLEGQDLHPIEVYDRKFLEGQKVRVLDGPLKGAVGVVKRIKGDRRLVVSISGIAAVATSYVSPEMLESVE